MWFRVVSRLALAASLCFPPGGAFADESMLSRAGGAVGGFFRSFADLLIPGGAGDEDLDRALETYAKGSYFTTFFHASRLHEKHPQWLGDEADLLAGLSAAAADVREEAVAQLRAILESDGVSPYYPVALAALLELEARLGNTRAGAAAGARYLGDFWQRPRSPREAVIKGTFLESGNLTPEILPSTRQAAGSDSDILRRQDRPADRAVYLAGTALLREQEFDKAAACLEAITPLSLYYAYARYGLAQAMYGLKRLDHAESMLKQVYNYSGLLPGELYLRERAALLLGQILHELDEDSAAIRWLRRVDREGPFGLHAAVLAAEIQADRERPALALVYLKDRPTDSVEPKLVARAVAIDAELHREMRDTATAIQRLEEGIRVLEQYATRLREAGANGRVGRLLEPLERRQRTRDLVEDWRRRNVANAVPDLLTANATPGWVSQMLAGWLASNPGEDGYPVIFYRRQYDPFAALPAPRDGTFEPPGDSAFPTLFRRSLGEALNEALRYELELRTAVRRGDAIHLALLLLDGELRLATQSEGDEALGDRVATLGFDGEVSAMIADRRARPDVLLAAMRAVSPEGFADRREPLQTAAGDLLGRWEAYQHRLVREAVDAEEKAVQELRFALEFELSQTLAQKQVDEKQLLQGDLPTS